MPAARLTTLLGVKRRPWMAYAACRNAIPSEFAAFVTPEDGDDPQKREPSQPPAAALKYCDLCEVRPACLAAALACGEVGVWGGTSSHQRRQLLRRIPRRHCPGCGNEKLFTIPDQPIDVCPSCGTSWETVKPPAREERSA